AVAPPAPITQAPPQAAPSYYVVTDYNGAASLESARGAVGDAYVRDFSNGTRIQMGAFSQESSARNLVNQLQGQGIPAQVISP
ncbi:SPOR domain-containing protein, partial [Nodosilinea sp. LEGE 07298]|uniref:SPOR domain-containing protein n=1 Tax=Nodosilinea sp. LEGE 07298 TaxID=2777970 RepID=UPI00187F6B37